MFERSASSLDLCRYDVVINALLHYQAAYVIFECIHTKDTEKFLKVFVE